MTILMTRQMTRQTMLRFLLAGMAMTAVPLSSGAARAADVKLFRIVSPKDDIVIGVTDTDLGAAPDLKSFADAFQKAGKIEVWRYASKKEASGDLVQAPNMRIMLVWSDVLRIEPYASPLKIVSP